MKKITVTILLLCALLLQPFALAEDVYVPGEVSERLILDAWDTGKIITGDIKLRLDVDADAMGLDEEEAAVLEALLPLLDSVSLSLGAGKTAEGLRIEAGAILADAKGGDPVACDVAANFDLYGISVESGLLPDSRVSARWETLLAMAGVSDGDIETLIALRDMDWNTAIEQALEMLNSYVEIAMQLAQPYGEIIVSWAAALPMTLESAPAPEGYAAASCSSVTIMDKDIMRLAAALAERLKNDETVSGLCDLLIQEAYTGEGEAPTTVELCEQIIAMADDYAGGGDSIRLTLGTDEDGTPVFFVAEILTETEGTILLGLSGAMNEAGNADYAFRFDITNVDGSPFFGLTCTGEAGEALFTMSMQMTEALNAIMGMDYSMAISYPKSELPSMKIDQTITMDVHDGETTLQMVSNSATVSSLTADGGEVVDSSGAMDMYVDGIQLTTTMLETLAVYPAPEGFAGVFSFMESMPAMGLNAFGMDVALSCKAYDPAATAALHEIALETSSAETFNALLSTLAANAQAKLEEAVAALPEEQAALLGL